MFSLCVGQTWGASKNITLESGCIGHWKFYPDGDSWYDVEGFGLAHLFDFNEADAGYGRFHMIRVEEVPNTLTLAEVYDMCTKRANSSSYTEQAKNEMNPVNETSTMATDEEGSVEGDSLVDGDLSGAGDGRKLTSVTGTLVSAALHVFCI